MLVAGNLSLTWAYDPADPASADHVRRLFDRQLELQLGEGVDFVIAETFTWLGEALLAAERIKAAGQVAMVTMAYEQEPSSYEGHGPAECARRLVDAGADVVGINCLRNPATTLPLMREVRAAVSGFVACQPTAYRTPDHQHDFTALPEFPLGLDPLQLTREEMAAYARGGARDGDRLHRLVLRRGGLPRAGDGAGAGQAPRRGAGVAVAHRQADVGLRVLPARPRARRGSVGR